MKLDGKAIAENLLTQLTQEVTTLKQKGVTPTLAVILVGDDPGSLSYIRQKQKTAERIGANVLFQHFPATITPSELNERVQQFNNDSQVHGLIVQRPVPKNLGDVTEILNGIKPAKDVDGFVPNSPFQVPVAKAVLTLLHAVFEKEQSHAKEKTFDAWLRNQCSIVIGRGETAGEPIAKLLSHQGCLIEIIHSKTPHPEEIVKKFNIVVSCVGKERVVTRDMVTPQSILIGVGIWRDSQGKLRGDYNEEEISDIVAYYTPTPGGVGPVNVACLMDNLVSAAKNTL